MSGIGEANSAAERARAQKVLQAALAKIEQLPEPEQERVIAEMLGPSALESVQADPESVSAQKNVLGRLMELERNGGMTLEDDANLAKVQSKLARGERSNRAALLNSSAARGTLGSGAELAAGLQSQQAAADRANAAGMDVMASAQRRYLDSLQQRAGLSGQMRQQDFAERSQAAKAKDEIARYNTTARERAKYYNAQQPMQMADYRLRKATAGAGLTGGLATQHNQDADRSSAFWSGLGATAGRGIYDYGRSRGQDPYAGYSSYDPDDTTWDPETGKLKDRY